MSAVGHIPGLRLGFLNGAGTQWSMLARGGSWAPWGRESALDLEGAVPVGAGTVDPVCPQEEESPVGFQTGVESQPCPRLGWYLLELGLEPGPAWREADPHSLTGIWDPAHF